MNNERVRIRRQVRDFLAYLAALGARNTRDHLESLEATTGPTLLEMYGRENNILFCINAFVTAFVSPGNDMGVEDWETVLKIQRLMMAFMLANLYQDPVLAEPAIDGVELTSSSS